MNKMLRIFIKIFDSIIPPRHEERLVRSLSKTDLPLTPLSIEYTAPMTVGLMPIHNKNVRACIHEAKYHHNTHALTLLGTILSEYLHEFDVEESALEKTNYVIIPIPLTPTRQKVRGYNQIEEVLKATSLPSSMSIDTTILTKIRDTESQTRMTRSERIKNQKNVFKAISTNPHTHYIIIDDVITTGATMNSAIEALKKGGVRTITPITLSY